MDELNKKQQELMDAWYARREFDRAAWNKLFLKYLEAGRICAGMAARYRFNRICEQVNSVS